MPMQVRFANAPISWGVNEFGLASAVTRWLEAAYHDGSNGKG